MDGHLTPTALYVILALAVTVTARLADKDVREAEFLQKRPWLLVLLHVPVPMAWDSPVYLHWVIHAAVFGLACMACACTYAEQILHRRFDSAELDASSQ